MKHAPAFLKIVEETLPRIREVSSSQVIEMLQQNSSFHLVDVREDHEWHQGHIKGATHIGRGILERDIEAKIPDTAATIVLYCGGGYRSALSADNLQKMGYTNVFSLAGGWREWKEKNYPQA